ncbi:MAG: hypothetical protein AB1560_06595 [Pseudomonadota bacterium]
MLGAMLSLPATAASPEAADARVAIELPPMMRAHMLANMRDHLAALHEIQAALARDENRRAAGIAEQRLGMSSLDAHGAGHMAPHMPQPMQDIGTAMHRAASRFARTAEEADVRRDLRPALLALSEVTQQCTACHAGYRLK